MDRPLEGAREPDAALEQELAARLRAGQRDAFERLYESYRSRIYNLALRIVQSHEDARDITQEVFIKAYRQLPGDGHDLRLTPWLYRVAVNACYDHLRTRRRHDDLDEVHGSARAASADGFEQAELSRQLEQTLVRLSDRHRTVLLLKDVHGLHHDEIAGILGVSRGATETLLFRAREAFRRQYEDLSRGGPAADCELARRATVVAVGGDLPADERRKVTEHARYCTECRKTVESWGAAAVGLGALLPAAPLPAALQSAPFGTAASAGGTGAGAAASTGGAGLAGGGTAGATVGGVLAHIAGAAAVKIAVVAVAATCAVSAAGVAAYRTATAGPGADAPAAAQPAGGPKGGATAATTDARKSPRGNAYGPAGKQKPDKDAKKQTKREKSNNGKATGRAGDKNVKGKAEKPAQPAKPVKPAKPDQAKAPAKPEKPSAPEKPAKPEQAKAPAKPEKPARPAKPATPSPAGKPGIAVGLQLA